ncbi:hypothetical protein B1O53_17745, partial [Listeria monocytogenes]|nr:hypothetical protein [Listeria monocytogenes]
MRRAVCFLTMERRKIAHQFHKKPAKALRKRSSLLFFLQKMLESSPWQLFMVRFYYTNRGLFFWLR